MKRFLALLLLPLLLLAQSADALSALCGGQASGCVESKTGPEAHSCCEPTTPCECEAAPAHENAPQSPALPVPGTRGLELAALAAVRFAVANVEFADERPSAIWSDGPARRATPVRRTVLHCSFLI